MKTLALPSAKHHNSRIYSRIFIIFSYNINFDCLLADCEGFLLEFIRENGEFFDNLKCVIYEEDCGENHPINNTFINYSEVEQFLISKGFVLQETYRDKIGLDNKIWLRAD